MASNSISAEDMLFHALYIGSTGAGKTNALLYWLLRLFRRKDIALVLIDPHGDAAFDLVRMIPESERDRIALIDPDYVSFGLNPLSLPQGTDFTNRVQVLQTQVGELSALLSDVLNTDASTAPRLMWIFKGALYYLYSISDGPTFKDLYHILVDFSPKEQIEAMLRARKINDEIIRATIDAISKLQKDAFPPVVNRIANFVLPSQSKTSRTFCARVSKLDFEEMAQPGRLTIFRVTKSLSYDFRRLISAAIVMRFYFAVEKRASRLERAGEAPTARTPIILAIDEFQNISDLKLLDTILSESRKYGLYLWMVNQNIKQVREQLYSAISGNVGPIFCFRVGPEDATKMAELISPKSSEEVRKSLIKLSDYACVIRKRPHGENVASKPLIIDPFPKVREPLHTMKDVIDFMKGEMEDRYGGAEEAPDLVYKTFKQQLADAVGEDSSDPSRVSFMPLPWRILTIAYLKMLSDDYSVEYSRIRSDLFHRYGWKTSDVQQALNDLVNQSYLTQSFTRQQYIVKGRDEFGNPIWVPPDPAVMDDMQRATTVVYALTPRALEWFRMRVGPSKMGDVKHARVIEKLLKEQYWPMLGGKIAPGFLAQLYQVAYSINVDVDPVGIYDAKKTVRSYARSLGSRLILRQNEGRSLDPEEQAEFERASRAAQLIGAGKERLFRTRVRVVLRERTYGDLVESRKKLRQLVGGMVGRVDSPSYFQEPLLTGVGPRYATGRWFFVTTSGALNLFPFCGLDIVDPSGVFFGQNLQTQNAILYDVFEKDNYNIAVMGTTGLGKSTLVKTLMSRMALLNEDMMIYAFDSIVSPEYAVGPDGTYENSFAGITKCHVHRFDPKGGAGLDPFRVFGDPDLAAKFIGDILDLPNGEDLDELHLASRKVSNVQELYSVVPQSLRKKLESRLPPYEFLFKGETTFYDKMVFVLNDIENPELRDAAMFLSLSAVWTLIKRAENDGRKAVIIDEGWALVEKRPGTGKPYFPMAVDYVPKIARTGRHYRACFLIATQLVSDFMGRGNEVGPGREMVESCATKIVLKQDEAASATLTEAFRLSEMEEKFIVNPKIGQGILVTPEGRLPFYNMLSDQERRLFTTRPSS